MRFGAYNADQASYTEIESDIDDARLASVHAMTIMDKRMYVIYGDDTVEDPEFSILVANLP